MKKVILSVAAVFAFGFANAQDATNTMDSKGFANGDTFMSGTVGFRSTSTGDVKESAFTIAPKAGLFVTDNIAIGVELAYLSNKTENGVDPEATSSGFGIGAFARYYATPASDFSFVAELGAGYITSKYEQGPIEGKANGFVVALTPGVSYFISSNFALEAQIGELSYNTTKPDVDGAESTDTFNINLDLSSISFGLLYKF